MMMAALFDPYREFPGLSDLIVYKLSADAITAPELRVALISSSNHFRFLLTGISNRTYVTEWSSDLRMWSPLGTNRLMSGAVEVVDGAVEGKRFYRSRMVE